MCEITYKIYLPFYFGVGNSFLNTKLTIKEFKIDDVFIRLTLDEKGDKEKSFLFATTQIDDNQDDIFDKADVKIGKAVQSFFDGLSKAISNAGFFNIFNGDTFLVKYEVFFRGWHTLNPYNDSNNGFALDDEIVSKAIEYANSKNRFIKQAYCFLKEAEYFVDIGRFSSAVIQFAIMTEYLINHVLSNKNIINKDGKLKSHYNEECEEEYKKIANGRPPFVFQKYVYGLSKLEMKLDDDIIESIDIIYKLRNKLAHGHNTIEAFELCRITYEDEEVTEYNIYNFMVFITNYMTIVYNFFSKKFK